MKKCLLVFIALSVLVTSCTSKYVIPAEQVLQDPDKYKIVNVITTDGEFIEFPDGVTIQDNRIVGRSKDGTLKEIPLSEIENMSYVKVDIGKSVGLGCGILGCIGVVACVAFYILMSSLP